MRTVAEAEKHWHQLDDFHSLTDLKISVSAHSEPQITAGLRSVCWKIFLLFKTLDRSSWPNHLNESRSTYSALRFHYLRAITNPDEFESAVDPLSENEESPWVALRADESLRAEIFQDIERCMPDNTYFRQPATQNMMLDILFVWCKMHPDIGYRQGMHEVLAPILWVVERDAVDTDRTENREVDHTLAEVMDSNYIEHDTSTLFSLVMNTAMTFYAPADPGSVTKETPMLIRSARIFERYLPKADPDLAAHLVKLEIVPQIFLLRWIRLLFGREFPLDSVLNMWDALFAIDPTLELVDMISIAMLLRIRWQLLASDINESFSMLLRYPEPDSPAYTFIKDALYLRDNLTPEGGAEIITRYGQQAPKIEARSPPTIRAPSPSPSSSSNRTRQGIASPRSVIQQGVGFEALLQGAAKGVLERGSQWGVGKVIRDAVGEVRKNVEAYQSGPVSLPSTPRSGGREYRKPGQIATTGAMNKPGLERTMSGNMIRKMEGQERRNKGLAKMLDTAVAELWDYHKERSEAGDIKDNKDSMEMLSLAIAKVQFVQVYLEDSSIPLPPDDQSIEQPSGPGTPNLLTPTPASPIIPERTSSAPPIANAYPKPLPSASASATPQPLENNKEPAQLLSPLDRRPSATPASASSSLPPRSRPMLTSSNFSWMLGQESTPSTFVSGTAHTAFPSDEKRRMRGSISGKGFLFGDEDDEGNEKEGKKKKTKDKKNGKKDTEVEEEVIDLEDVGSRAVF